MLRLTRMGRPKGSLGPHISKMLGTWDALKRQNPKLNNEALIELVAQSSFGSQLNGQTENLERTRVKRILKRHNRL
jgi:hypothetical protein